VSAPEAGTRSRSEVAPAEAAEIERQLEALERAVAPRPPGWAWILVVVGFALAIGLAAHAGFAYVEIDRVNQSAKLQTPNAVLLLQDLAVNGTRVSTTIDVSSRAVYGGALRQYVLDGTGVCLGLALAFGGLFIRINR
jgi:hypothetical protein